MKTNYSDLIELGFKRDERGGDEVFFSEYGYKYFTLSYEKGLISFEWMPTNREITMYINSITYKKDISLDEVREIINMLNAKM